jgi:hypothetical protein
MFNEKFTLQKKRHFFTSNKTGKNKNKESDNEGDKDQKIRYFEGRWTFEEEKLFEKNYKNFLNKKITIKQLKKSIPTRTFLQVSSHITKMKYYYEKKFSIIMDPNIKKNINYIKKFYSNNNQNQNQNQIQNQNEDQNKKSLEQRAEKAMIILNDPIKKKNFAISIENLILLKSILPGEKKIKLDSNLIYNLLLLKKANFETKEMLIKHDEELDR